MLSGLARLTDFLDGFRATADAPVIRAIRKDGFHVVPDFLDRATCAALRAQVDELLTKFKHKVQHEQSEGTSGDYRLFGAETQSPLLSERVAAHPWLRRIGSDYMRTDLIAYFSMTNKVEYVEGMNCNSGAGWHRDSAGKQFKAIVYLTDVTTANGPFTILPDSRTIQVPARANARNANRFDDEAIAALSSKLGRQAVEVVGSAGTCVLVDTSHIHRGKDIQSGVRYAITNYYYANTPRKRQQLQEKWGRHLIQPLI